MIRVATANMFLTGNWYIDSDQSAMMSTEAELSSGKQLNSPADNPVGAGEAALLQSNESELGQYAGNQAQASQFLNDASSTLTQGINVLQSVNSSLVEAGNPTLSSSGRSALASQLQQDLNQLVGLANTSDNEGGYLFAGSQTASPPFVQNGNSVTYTGDSLEPTVQISATRSEQIKYSGASVFMQIPTGNGTFTTAPAGANTGTGALSTGSVTAPGALTGDDYSITMGGAAAGSPATTYTIKNTSTGATVASGGFTSPANFAFDGMSMQLSGTPDAGDSFTVAPSTNQSVFSTIAGAIAALQAPNSTTAQATQNTAAISGALAGVGNAITGLSTTQSSMGAQLQELQTYTTINSDQNLQDQTQVSSIVDLNYASGVSQLTQQQTQFQAALQSYATISKLSLFNYIG